VTDLHPCYDPDNGEPEVFDSLVFQFEDGGGNLWELADLIKQGWHQYYVSNYTEEMMEYLRDIKSEGARCYVTGGLDDRRAFVLVRDSLHAATIALRWAS
jgi:hypothetical protein